jgi:uncharacterized coiled-coil protein SlyX
LKDVDASSQNPKRRKNAALQDADANSERLEKIETQLAFVERQYDELNQVVIEQSRQLARIQAELARATHAMSSLELERIRANNQKPPHYQ